VGALSDSIFAVRIRAAYALSALDYVPVSAAHKQAYNADIAQLQSVVGDSGIMADDPNMHMDVGQLYEDQHDFHKALQQYQYTLRFAPGLAEAQSRTEQLLESESQYQKLVKLLSPLVDREVRAQVALGLIYVHRGKVDEGVKLLDKATSAGVRSELVETGLGDAYRSLGQFDVAVKHYQAALNMSPEFPGAHHGLALLAYEQGDADVGRRHWAQFLKTRGSGSSAEKVRALFGAH